MGKRRRRADQVEWGRGACGGYSDFRYGDAKPVSLAGSATAKGPLIKAAAREAMIDRTVELLRDWKQTPFENEGPFIAGLRSGLCLKGHAWTVSDAEAAGIVAAALRRVDAKRPSWEQGQREYLTPRENCAWCAGDLPTDLMPTTYAKSFCSDECARFAIHYRNLQAKTEGDDAYRAARRVIEKRRLPPRACEQCGDEYHPRFGRERFCSPACVSKSRQVHQPRPCKACQKVFRPKSGATLFCSDECRLVTGGTKTYTKECVSCGSTFEARSSTARACSKPCQHLQNGWKPSTISRPVFDHFITLPADEFHRRRITPQKFDWLALEMGFRITGEVEPITTRALVNALFEAA